MTVSENRYVSLKLLTENASLLVHHGTNLEWEILRAVNRHQVQMKERHCLTYYYDFVYHEENGNGKNVCYVSEVLGPSLDLFGQHGRFTIPAVKKILRDVLCGLSVIHEARIAHMGLHHPLYII